ncbi:MAG: IPT/TIG domain-containing protein [Paludibacter sp.]|nr:IPT/TIG domain-containing protein [Paludibacter sp.]
MKKIIYNIRLLLLVCVVTSIGLWTSCTSDNSVSIGSKVELISFGPAGVQLGDTISFIGNNLNNVTKIKFVGDSVLQAAFIKQSSGLIKVIVPPYTTRGFVTLYAPKDTVVSKTMFDLLVPVTITSFPTVVRPGGTMTITGQFVNWISEVWFSKNVVVRDSNFISKSLTQVVLKVPMTAQTGPIVINTRGVKPLSINPVDIVTVTLPAITSFAPIPVARGGNLTITGTDLDLTKGIIFKGSGSTGVTDTVKTFVSISPTQIVVTVPQTTAKGPLTLVAYSNLPIVSTTKVQLVGDIPDLAPLAYAFYEDAVVNGWSEWGWGRTADYANTDFVRDGNYSMKVTYTAQWSGVAFQNSSVSTANYTNVVFSVYGGPGTDGLTIVAKLNWGTGYNVTIQEGKWQEFSIPISALDNPATITSFMLGNAAWTGVVYFDHIGLR